MAHLYITFGSQYRTEKHPTFNAAHPDGYLTVVYPEPSLREHARMAAWQWLNRGEYAMDYDEEPDRKAFPRGELAMLILP